jgi:gliding motility-associated-like protein
MQADGTYTETGRTSPAENDATVSISDVVGIQPQKAYYKVAVIDECTGKPSISSERVASLLLTAHIEDNRILLDWNEEKQFRPNNYQLFRLSTNNDLLLLTTKQNYIDAIDSLQSKGLSSQICYRVHTHEVSAKEDFFRISNVACVEIAAKINMPAGFTPNGDGINDRYRPAVTFIPNSYKMLVFNRLGVKIYETADINSGWDGKNSLGQIDDEGVYIYYVKIINAQGKTIEQQGTFSLYKN